MSNFVELLLDVLEEKHKTFNDLENAGIICKRTFYQYKTYTPFLGTILKIANFLEVSLDYLADRTPKNNFKPYNIEQVNFFENLTRVLKSSKISKTKLSADLKIGRPNFTYWKNGSLPKFITLIDLSNYLNCDIDDLLNHK